MINEGNSVSDSYFDANVSSAVAHIQTPEDIRGH